MVDEKQIEPHVSVWDKTQRSDETLSSSDFQWDAQANEYRCPQGRRCAVNGAHSSARERASPRPTPSSIIQPSRLREVPDEVALLSEHTDSEDRS